MPHSTFLTGSQIDAPLAALAAEQHGLVRFDQLRALGLSSGAITKRAQAGRLHRVHRGVYAVGHRALSREGRWMAGVLAVGPGAALSHMSAAALLGITRRRTDAVHVTVAQARRVEDIEVHVTRRLDRVDVTRWYGIPVTTVARVLVDLTATLADHELANLIHEAAYLGRFSAAATRDAMARANGRPNLNVLEAAIAAHESGSAGTKSGLERRFRALVRDLPPPLSNVRVLGFEVDVYWPALKLCVELDGPGHRRALTRREDAARDKVLRAAGFRLLRYTEEDLDERPEWVRASIAASTSASVL